MSHICAIATQGSTHELICWVIKFDERKGGSNHNYGVSSDRRRQGWNAYKRGNSIKASKGQVVVFDETLSSLHSVSTLFFLKLIDSIV